VQPNDAGYTATRSGMNCGCLRGPSTAGFDLALYQRAFGLRAWLTRPDASARAEVF
jgi:hypothetical protein